MPARDLLRQMPPDPLERIGLGRGGGSVMEHDAKAPSREVLMHGLTLLAARIITYYFKRELAYQVPP